MKSFLFILAFVSLAFAQRPITIHFDYSLITNIGLTQASLDYFQKRLAPPVKNYLEAAVSVRRPTLGNLKSNVQNPANCNLTIPSQYMTEGVPADLVIFIGAKVNTATALGAYTETCIFDSETNRPLIGHITFSFSSAALKTDTESLHNNVNLLLHEVTHALGFNYYLMNTYINPETLEPLTGHLFTKTINGVITTIIDLPPLTQRLRTYFNCSTLEGGYLENQGEEGIIRTHWERRIFNDEYMTASVLRGSKISEFTLALLEGTGWYVVNYDLAEPVTYAKNKGCGFFEQTCINTTNQSPNFAPEFCTLRGPVYYEGTTIDLGTSTGCDYYARSSSTCGVVNYPPSVNSLLQSSFNYWGNGYQMLDQYSDNCPMEYYRNTGDCESSATVTALNNRGIGSKCFTGTLTTSSYAADVFKSYCLKSSCGVNEATNSYYINITIGTKSITCTGPNNLTVPGYNGVFACPDPQEWCPRVRPPGAGCVRKCSGRGSCSNNACQCQEGWSGVDCATMVYTDQAPSCANKNPFKTSKYGDKCTCNPNNATCSVAPAGYYQDGVDSDGFGIYKECPVNFFTNTSNKASCDACPENYSTKGLTGQTQCSYDCPAGTFSANNDENCALCPVNTFTDTTGNNQCKPCETGYSTKGLTGQTQCIYECPAGTFDANNNGNCALCPFNTFTDASGSNQCKPCATGYTTKGLTGQSQCIYECLAGTFDANNDGTCTSCPVDTYTNTSGNSQCKPCKTGYTTRGLTGQTQCLYACPAGTYSANNNEKCTKCPVNTFTNTPGNSQCKPCASGYTTQNKKGQTQCFFTCLPGTYSPNPVYSPQECEQCSFDSIAKNAGSKKCTKCPLGWGSSQGINCDSCAPGFEFKFFTCLPCSITYYNPVANGTCLKCKSPMSTDKLLGATSCTKNGRNLMSSKEEVYEYENDDSVESSFTHVVVFLFAVLFLAAFGYVLVILLKKQRKVITPSSQESVTSCQI